MATVTAEAPIRARSQLRFTANPVQIGDLLGIPPAVGAGHPTGIDDWRFVVELAMVEDAANVWGTGEWGTARWVTLTWVDITSSVRGCQWRRGSDEPYGRARAGELNIQLSSSNDEWSPMLGDRPTGSPRFFAPGTVIRVGLRSAGDHRAYGWLPQFAGIVESWTPAHVGARADSYINVQAFETVSALATIDDNALSSPVGANEDPLDRLDRLLTAADWPYGLTVTAENVLGFPSSYPLAATDMALNRLGECYLVADSTDTVFRTDPTGRALLSSSWYGTGAFIDEPRERLTEFSSNFGRAAVSFTPEQGTNPSHSPLLHVAYDADSPRITNDRWSLYNDVRLARVGGSQVVSEQTASIARWGRRTYSRNDLIIASDSVVTDLARYISTRRGLNTLRVDRVEFHPSDMNPDHALALLAVDYYDLCFYYDPTSQDVAQDDRAYITGFVAGLEHDVTPRSDNSVTWRTAMSIDTFRVVNVPGAQATIT